MRGTEARGERREARGERREDSLEEVVIDMIHIRSAVEQGQVAHLARLHRLREWVSQDGRAVEYKSDAAYQNMTGVYVTIKGGRAELRLSLHKYWQHLNFGHRRNDNLFSLEEAFVAVDWLLKENQLAEDRTWVQYFEVGVSMQMPRSAREYIEQVRGVAEKTLYIDANYKKNRQKTGDKSRFVRRYMKMYDKTWEMDEKGGLRADGDVLRVESVYKRVNRGKKGEELNRLDRLFSRESLIGIEQRFFRDVQLIRFERGVVFRKRGARMSEIERAKEILNKGAAAYREKIDGELAAGAITQTQYRTMREFLRDYESGKIEFTARVSEVEREFFEAFGQAFQKVRL